MPEKKYDDRFESLRGRLSEQFNEDEINRIVSAYEFAKEAHYGQCRYSGEPYIMHPVAVAEILFELGMDPESMIAALLHDTVEDTETGLDKLSELFGADVAALVDGVTKLGKVPLETWEERQAENLRKMFIAMSMDIRVVIIKLADRLHNMRTLKFMKPEKQREKARETMDIYAPIAQRLGISKIKIELDDLSLKYLEPDVYKNLTTEIAARKSDREAFIQTIVSEVGVHIENAGIEAKIDGRVKHFFSIYKKMVNQNKTLEQIYDLFAVRIIVDSVKECYAALGVIHEMYKPIPGRFKDYIAMPKANNYQSLHTTLIGSNGQPFEIQIRTFDMHRTAEYGIAAHWKYKEGKDGNNNTDSEEEKLNWLKQILEWQQDMSDNKEFLSLLKSDLDLFSDSVYCFTPTGDVKDLPSGSTPIDFAYSIHSAVGNKMVGARVNGKMVTIDYVIQNGDRVEIITSQNSRGPSRDWLSIVKSTQAKNKINQWFRSQLKDENILKGKELIIAYAKAKGLPYHDFYKSEYQEKVQRKYGFHSWDDCLATIGHGGIKEGQIVNRMYEEYKKDHPVQLTDADVLDAVSENKAAQQKPRSKSGIVVKGLYDMAVHFSKCCSPVPGDEIIGFVTRGRGVSIHRTDCINMLNLTDAERVRLIEAEWQPDADLEELGEYFTELKMFCNDKPGILVEVSRVFAERDINILGLHSRSNKQGVATIEVSFNTKGRQQIQSLMERLRQIENIIEIQQIDTTDHTY